MTRPGLLPQPCSMTLITSLNTESLVYWTTRNGSNTQLDFIDAIRGFVARGALVRGDFLVMDNASVHTGDQNQQQFQTVLDEAGVTVVRLPTYSPELNPCEFVFARIKNFIRSPQALMFDYNRNQTTINGNFDSLVNACVSLISLESMMATYEHCRTLERDSHISTKLVQNGLIAWDPSQ